MNSDNVKCCDTEGSNERQESIMEIESDTSMRLADATTFCTEILSLVGRKFEYYGGTGKPENIAEIASQNRWSAYYIACMLSNIKSILGNKREEEPK